MVEIRMTYAGSLRVEATHGPSGTTLHTDAPVDNYGKGESFSPTDLVATALGACMATIMGIAAERHDVSLEGMTIDVQKHMATEPVRRIGKLVVRIGVPHDPGPEMRKRLEAAAHACPVHRSIHPDVEIPVEFVWGDASS